MGLVVTTEPSIEPVTLADAKLHLRQDETADDTLISGLISAARRQVEAFLRRPLITTRYRWTLDGFLRSRVPCQDLNSLILRTPVGGVRSVTSIGYRDVSNLPQTLDPANYSVDVSEQPARIAPGYSISWPATFPQMGSVTIEFVAGYGDNAADVPADIIAALKLILGHLYENREATMMQYPIAEIPMGAEHLLWPHRVHVVGQS